MRLILITNSISDVILFLCRSSDAIEASLVESRAALFLLLVQSDRRRRFLGDIYTADVITRYANDNERSYDERRGRPFAVS